MISVVCPFYNEEIILAKAIDRMISNLKTLEDNWELIIVNDGSIDQSLQIAEEKSKAEGRIKIVSYKNNKGRGHALMRGIEAAQGDIIVTTEVDCSWGDTVVNDLANALKKDKSLDIVIASTNLSKGGYVNVPFSRVAISKLGNIFLSFMLSKKITMFTGMTRGYRAEAIKTLPISEDGKEFHLDVIIKARAFGLKIGEVPATLTWQDEKLARANAPKRKSSSKIPKIIRSHLLFGLSGRPYRYLFMMCLISFVLSLAFLSWGIFNLLNNQVSIYLLTLSFSSFILSVVLGGIGVITLQQNAILRELWITRKEIKDSIIRK